MGRWGVTFVLATGVAAGYACTPPPPRHPATTGVTASKVAGNIELTVWNVTGAPLCHLYLSPAGGAGDSDNWIVAGKEVTTPTGSYRKMNTSTFHVYKVRPGTYDLEFQSCGGSAEIVSRSEPAAVDVRGPTSVVLHTEGRTRGAKVLEEAKASSAARGDKVVLVSGNAKNNLATTKQQEPEPSGKQCLPVAAPCGPGVPEARGLDCCPGLACYLSDHEMVSSCSQDWNYKR